MDYFSELTAFVQAARDQSFSAAARHLDLTPSAVSKLVSRLENRLEIRLFSRQARSVILTEEGRSYLGTAQAAVDAMEQAIDRGHSLKGTISGTIRVHTMLTFARHQIVPWLPEFMERYPYLKVDLVIGPQFSDVFDEGVDVAIHSGKLPDSSLVARTIASSRWIICASPSYLEQHGTPTEPEDLAKHVCVGFTFKSEWNLWPCRSASGEQIKVQPNYAVTTSQGEVARDLALNGFGIVRLAEFHIGQDLARGRLVPLLVHYQDQTKEPIQLIYPSRKNVSQRVRAFCDYLEMKAASQSWTK